MNIENYLNQLVDDIGELLEQVPPGNLGSTEGDDETEQTELPVDSWEDSGVSLTRFSGIGPEHLPRPDLLNELQRESLTGSLLSLLYHCGVYPEFPEDVSDAEKYPYLRNHWERFRAPLTPVNVHYTFCNYDPETCPFPATCRGCDSRENAFGVSGYDASSVEEEKRYLERRKEQIIQCYHEMPEKHFISGVHNYCDRWCEHCDLADFCSVCALDRKRLSIRGGREDESLLLTDVQANFEAIIEMIQEWMEEEGIDPDTFRGHEAVVTDPELPPDARGLMSRAEEYARDVHGWLGNNFHTVEGSAGLARAIGVISWYYTLIPSKLYRAFMGRELDFDQHPVQNDSNGSAKVVIDCIRKSMAAWSWMIRQLEAHEDSSLRFAAMLNELLKQITLQFPDAEKFIRPGFDQNENEWVWE